MGGDGGRDVVELFGVGERVFRADGGGEFGEEFARVAAGGGVMGGAASQSEPGAVPVVEEFGGMDFDGEFGRDVARNKFGPFCFAAFVRAIGAVAGVVKDLRGAVGGESHAGHLVGKGASAGIAPRFLRHVAGEDGVLIVLVVDIRIGDEEEARLDAADEREQLIAHLGG